MKNSSRLFLFSLPLILFALFSLTNCNKSDHTSTFVAQDTLGSGWTKMNVYGNAGSTGGGDIFFNSTSTGFLSGQSRGTFRSTDGGNTWTEIFRAGGGSLLASNIAMTSDNKAFFVRPAEDSIFKTLNLGATVTGCSLAGASPSDIFLADNNTGLCSSDKGIFKTTDGGNSWNNIYPLPNFIASYSTIFMFDPTNAWVCYSNKVFHANGSLASFKLDSVPAVIPNIGLISVFATSASTVYVSSNSGYVFKSVDAGNTFSVLKKLDGGYRSIGSDLHFVDANTGYMSLGSRIFKTTDAGNTWTMVVALGSTSINEIHFIDATHGWACCTDGYILKFN